MRLQNVKQDMEEGATWEGTISGGWEMRNTRGGEMGKVSTYFDGVRQSFLINLAWLPMSGIV